MGDERSRENVCREGCDSHVQRRSKWLYDPMETSLLIRSIVISVSSWFRLPLNTNRSIVYRVSSENSERLVYIASYALK